MVDLAELVGAVVADARTRYEDRPIEARLPERLVAQVDPLRLEQVLTNLLDNAAKYSPPGTAIEVELRTAAGGRRPAAGDDSAPAAGRRPPAAAAVAIAVRDYGPGIPVAKRGQIFERFYQAHTRTRSGMGLGLYISRQIVQLHGGELEAEFPEDGGSRFVVRLPIGDEQSGRPPPSA